jgi:hypothetical protein
MPLSVLLSVRVKQLGYRWKDLREILYLSIFRKYVDQIQVSLKSDKKRVPYNKTNMHFRHVRKIAKSDC